MEAEGPGGAGGEGRPGGKGRAGGEGRAGGAADSKWHDALFADLMRECRHNPAGARLSSGLRQRLESLRPEERRALVSRTKHECAPLLVAARRGNAEAVEYLVHVCGADLEQRGVYEEPEDRSRHSVTPLWCAAVAGRAAALRVLLAAGAAVDAPSGTGSTPVRSACYMTHIETVRMLVGAGADVSRANQRGGTCLINAVQSARLCALLLAAGADVDARDDQGKTALLYAVQEHRVETVRLLLRRGADPLLRSKAGDDALRTAALKGSAHIVRLLLARGGFGAARAADAHELLGATSLDEGRDRAAALAAWRHATALREADGGYVEKEYADCEGGEGGAWWAEGAAAALGAREWRGAAQLAAAAAAGADALRAQALLVAARVLGVHHKDTLFRIIYRGAAYADEGRHQRCVELWLWALRLQLARRPTLCPEGEQTALALTRLLLAAAGGRLRGAAGGGGEGEGGVPRAEDAVRLVELLADASAAAGEESEKGEERAEDGDREGREERLAVCALHALHVALGAARGEGEWGERLERAARRLVARGAGGAPLLHLAVARARLATSVYMAEDPAYLAEPVLPSARVARLLLRAGAAPGALAAARATPLHVAAQPHNYDEECVEVLLAAGAHLDQADASGESALELLGARAPRLQPLACRAARVLARLPRAPPLPPALQRFLDLHRPPPPHDDH